MKATVTTKEFLEAIKTIEGSLNIKQQDSILSKICIKIKSYYLELVATDGNSLTMARINPDCDEAWDKDLIDKEFLVNINTIKRAIDKSSHAIELEFNYTDNNKTITISNNGLSVVVPSINGQYPKYERLMPYNDNYDEIKRDENETVAIGMSRKLLLDILKSYDSKYDDILKFEIPKDNFRYIGIQPYGINSSKKYSMLMPVVVR